MKNTSYFLLIGVLAISLFTKSCDTDDFLDRPAKGSLDEEVVADPEGVETLLMGAYASLSEGGWSWITGNPPANPWEREPGNWLYGSVMGMEAHKGSEPGDQGPMNVLGAYNHTPTHGFLNSKWVALYEGIARANSTLGVLEDVEVVPGTFTEEDKTRIEGEARFIRGHFYFQLARFFGDVPLLDEDTDELTPQPRENPWPFIEEDFELAMNNLPPVQNEVGRANEWAAASYLAKTYLYQEEWDDAANLFSDVINNGNTSDGQPYELVDLDKVHNPVEKNHSESVFAIQASADDGTGDIENANPGWMLNYPFSDEFRCCGFYQPTQFLVNAYQTDDGLPMVDDHLSTEVESDMGYASGEQFEPHEGSLDPRLDWTVGRRGVPYHDWRPYPGRMWTRDQAYAGPYYAKKHIWWRQDDDVANNPNSWAPGSSYNIQVIRFADVLLMAAEAEIELGNLGQARDYINRVRERAANEDAWVNNDFNRGYAHDIVNSEQDMLDSDPSSGDWVVRDDEDVTYVFLGGDSENYDDWNRYPNPADNYEIELYDDLGGQQQAREIVRFERKLELALEGHRFFDLVRWGIAEEELREAQAYETGKVSGSYMADGDFSPHNALFPIPQAQIDLSTVEGEEVLDQNPGY